MALGFCPSCECLKSIGPVALELGSRQCKWRTIRHDKRIHTDCGAVVDLDESADGDVYTCRKCVTCVSEHDVTYLPCDGHKRDIPNIKTELPPLESLRR